MEVSKCDNNILKKFHDENNHCSKDKLFKLKYNLDIYLDSLDFLLGNIMRECPICVAKYFYVKLNTSTKIINDIGPHYRYLMDINYLMCELDLKKTNYKYKFYWPFHEILL